MNKMKRTYSDMTLSLLPKLPIGHPDHFKSTLDGSYTLTVKKVTDISKPTQRPIDDVEEPEEDEVAQQNKLNKGNARMIQLQLVDSDQTEITAIETEKIERLTFIKPKCIISIKGPIELRCRNLMLQNKHVTNIQQPPKEEPKTEPTQVVRAPVVDIKPIVEPHIEVAPSAPTIDPTVKLEQDVKPRFAQNRPQPQQNQEVVIIDEDWDEDDEEDCIVLN